MLLHERPVIAGHFGEPRAEYFQYSHLVCISQPLTSSFSRHHDCAEGPDLPLQIVPEGVLSLP